MRWCCAESVMPGGRRSGVRAGGDRCAARAAQRRRGAAHPGAGLGRRVGAIWRRSRTWRCALIGEGEATLPEGVSSAARMRSQRVGLAALVLGPKEGLALINGTQVLTALGRWPACSAPRPRSRSGGSPGRGALEAIQGLDDAVRRAHHAVARPPGPEAPPPRPCARCSAESEIVARHADCGRVQDPYSRPLRAAGAGRGRDTLAACAARAGGREPTASRTTRWSSSTDGREVISGGNFHGQPVALAPDLTAMALAGSANISERRLAPMVNPRRSRRPHAVPGAARSGLDSGFMIAQVTSASLASENKVLCHPASVDSPPHSGQPGGRPRLDGRPRPHGPIEDGAPNREVVVGIEVDRLPA